MPRFTRWLRPTTSSRAALRMEPLESREVPAVITVTSLADDTTTDGLVTLREAIQAAETDTAVDGSTAGSGADTIVFDPTLTGTVNLSLIGDTTYGPTAFGISSAITINGFNGNSGITLARDGAVTNLRLFYVTGGGNLTLQGLTLSGGAALGGDGTSGNAGGGGGAGMGGAVFNEGTMTIVQSTLTGNQATGGRGGDATGSGATSGDGGGPNGGTFGGWGGFGGGGAGGIPVGGNGGWGGFGGGGGGQPDLQGGLGGWGHGGFGGGNAGSDWALAGGGGAGFGGAVFNNGGTLTIANSTLAGNSATGGAGGVANAQPASPGGASLGGGVFSLNGWLTVQNSTISGNTASDGGRGIYALGDGATVNYTLNNTIVGESNTTVTDVVAGTINGGATNGVGANNIIPTSAGVSGLTGTITADPLLSPLASNGGPTQTMAINGSSPAFNAGDNAAVGGAPNDQRGGARVRVDGGTVDIGAFEFDPAPSVTGVSGPVSSTYLVGQTLDFTVTFSENVTVDTTGGTPRIQLTIGSTTRYATFASGSGTNTLTFQYTVQSGDLDTDGIASSSPIDLNGGTIQDATANSATLTFTPPNTTAVLVDAVAPTISNVAGPGSGTYVAGANLDFTVTFSEAVTVDTTGGTPTIQLTIGSTTVNAAFVSGSGTNTLVFRYIVQTGDLDTDGIASASSITLNGGTIKDAAGNNATLTFTPPSTSGVMVDAVAPTITSVTGPSNGTYIPGQNLDFTVTFSENVNVALFIGSADIQVTIGSATVNATYLTGSGTNTLTFRYTVQSGDLDTNGVATGSTVSLSGVIAIIYDNAGNNAVLTFTPPNTTGVLVDAIAPTVSTVSGPTSGTYVAGQTLDFTVTFSENVTVDTTGGTPRIQLTVGGSTVYANYQSGSGTNTLTFRYTVQPGDTDTDGIGSTAPIDLNGGTIKDAATNSAVATFTPPNTTGVLVDTSHPSVIGVAPPANGAYKAGTNLDFVLTFSETVTVSGTPRVQLTIGGSTVWANYVSGSGTTALTFRYTVQAGNTDTDGVALNTSIDLNGGTIRDGATNDAATIVPPTATPNVTVDTTAPTAVITSPTPTATNATSIPVTVTFSENVTGFDVSDLVTGNATVSNFVAVNGHTYTFNLIPTADGAVSVGVTGFAGVTDAAGNSAVPPTALTRMFDSTAPTASIGLATNQNAVTGQNTVRFNVTFSEAVTGFTASDVTVGGTSAGGQVSVTGSGNTYVVTVSGMTRSGTVNIQVASAASTDAVGNPSIGSGVSPDVRFSPVPTNITTSTTGDGPDGTQIQIRDPQTGAVVTTIDPFPGFHGAVTTASADFNGDGVMDYAVGAGAGGGPHVKVFDGRTLDVLQSFFAYSSDFHGGVNVAAGDLDGDGRAEIITGAGAGGGPHVKAFDGITLAEVQSFFAYSPLFTGGVSVAAGDLDGDGKAEIITGAGAGGAPHVKAFNGQTLAEVWSFFAYDPMFTGGVNVGVRDVNHDGFADIVTGAGAGGGPHVKAFDGRTLAELQSFFAADDTFHGGVFVG